MLRFPPNTPGERRKSFSLRVQNIEFTLPPNTPGEKKKNFSLEVKNIAENICSPQSLIHLIFCRI
jgi:hypothetical protein